MPFLMYRSFFFSRRSLSFSIYSGILADGFEPVCVSSYTQSGSIKGEIYQCHTVIRTFLQRCHAVFHPLLQSVPGSQVWPNVNDKQFGK